MVTALGRTGGAADGAGLRGTAKPVNRETIRLGATGGFRGALGIQLASLVGDLCYSSMALLGVAVLLPAAMLRLLTPPVALVLIYLGYRAPHDGVRGTRRAGASDPGTARSGHAALRRGVLAGMGILLAHPFSLMGLPRRPPRARIPLHPARPRRRPRGLRGWHG